MASSLRELDVYLRELESYLHRLPVARRSELVLQARARAVEQGLPALGPARKLAGEFLSAEGFPPPPAGGERKKWVLGFLAAGLLALVAMLVTVYLISARFSPIVETDATDGTVRILGGLLEVRPKEGKITIAGREIRPEGGNVQLHFSQGEHTISEGHIEAKGVKRLRMEAREGGLEFVGGGGDMIRYRCQTRNEEGKVGGIARDGFRPSRSADGKPMLSADLRSVALGLCRLEVPEGMEIEARLERGQISFKGVAQDVDAKVAQGRIEFKPKSPADYEVRATVRQGLTSLPKPGERKAGEKPRFNAVLEVDQGLIGP
ncbi:MAG: hypothetical protein IT285_03675 [Bdellovibrionales bacterium]|nr:hypothetical protein [Bdellovibrionales bacterium]